MSKGWFQIEPQTANRFVVRTYFLDLTALDAWNELVERVEALEQSEAGGFVISAFGRTGVVEAEAGDYASFYDPLGAAAVVQADLDAHKADFADPHNTKAALQTFIAANVLATEDDDNSATTVLASDVDKFLNLEVFGSYENSDLVSFRVELPAVTGSTGNSAFILELVYDKGGPGEIVIASELQSVGNTTVAINTTIQGLVTGAGSLPLAQVGLYATGVSGTVTIDGSTGQTNYLLATRTRNFAFKAYPP